MNDFKRWLKKYLRGADLPLLGLCLCASAFGCVLISSAARPFDGGAAPFLRTQILSVGIGVVIYLVFTAVSLDWLAKFWKWILGFNIGLLLLLYPFGKIIGGNRSWLVFEWLPFNIGPPEIVKVSFILLLAAQMYRFRENASGVLPVAGYFVHTVFMAGLVVQIAGDLGVALIYVAILLVMMFGAGIKPVWFAAMIPAIAAAAPLLWPLLSDYQRNRILIILNPQMDPEGSAWHMLLSMSTLSRGGLTGQGLYQGSQTQKGNFPGIQTDFIFAACGEELGFLGCMALLVLLTGITVRVLLTARQARNGLGALVCFGVAGMMIFQIFENVLMCVGVTPVIGITLPFISYGGSSNIVMYAAMGLVSSVRCHPKMTWLDY